MKKIDLVGQTYGRLTVVSEEVSVGYRRFFLCKCVCGNTKKVAMTHLRTGHTQSCGCIFVENPPRLVHGYNRKNQRYPLYHVWDQMLLKCNVPTSNSYHKYGARGVRVCPEWHNPNNFIIWAKANGYRVGLTIDRKNPYGYYEPDNCRWVTTQEQGINKRVSVKNTSGFAGVARKRDKWSARITVSGKRIDLGCFDTPEEANTFRLQYMQANNLTEHLLAYENQQRNHQVSGSTD